MTDHITLDTPAVSPDPERVLSATYDDNERHQVPGLTVPGDADHFPHLQPAAVNHNSPEAQAFEAARAAVQASQAPQGYGWVSPEAHEAAERQAVAEELSREQAEAERAAREQAITDRLAARRGALGPEPAPEPARDGEFVKGLPRKA